MNTPYITDKPEHEKSIEVLKRENEYLRAENAYLKKLDALLTESKTTKARLIEGLKDQHPQALLLIVADMARSSFYYHVCMLQTKDKYSDLKQRICDIYHHHKGRYGYRRITQALKNEGLTHNHKLIARLMGELKLSARIRRQKYGS